jgi:hypothetical protein
MDGPRLVGFLDESRKPVRIQDSRGKKLPLKESHYAVATALVPSQSADEVRQALLDISHSLPKALHYTDLTALQRARALELLQQLPQWQAVVVETDRPIRIRRDRMIRGAVLTRMLSHLHDAHSIAHITLESRSDPFAGFARLDHDDLLLAEALRERGTLTRPFGMTHATKSETLLALADLIVGSRTDSICGVDDAPWQHVAHRVTVLQVPPRWDDPRNAEAPGH